MLAEALEMEPGSPDESPPKGAGKVRLIRLADLDVRTRARKEAERLSFRRRPGWRLTASNRAKYARADKPRKIVTKGRK